MNEIAHVADQPVDAGVFKEEDGKHYILAIDPVTGEEIKIELKPTGEFSQNSETDETGVLLN